MPMHPCMLVSRLTSLLALLLAVLGLAALPAGALAQDEPIDEEIELVEEDMWCDDEIVTEDDFADEDGTELRQVEEENPDEFFDEEDPDFLGPGEDDFDEEEPSDDDLLDDCTEDVADDAAETVGQIVKPDVSRIAKKGFLTASIRVPGKAKVTSTLTKGAKKLGHATQQAKKAGRFTIRIDLSRKGRRVVRSATGPLKLTLTAVVKPAKGKKTTRVLQLTA